MLRWTAIRIVNTPPKTVIMENNFGPRLCRTFLGFQLITHLITTSTVADESQLRLSVDPQQIHNDPERVSSRTKSAIIRLSFESAHMICKTSSRRQNYARTFNRLLPQLQSPAVNIENRHLPIGRQRDLVKAITADDTELAKRIIMRHPRSRAEP